MKLGGAAFVELFWFVSEGVRVVCVVGEFEDSVLLSLGGDV